MGRLIFRAFQCEMELEHITVSRLLLVPVAKGLWKHSELVSVNLSEVILAAVLRSAALFTVYDFETSYVNGSWLSAGLTIAANVAIAYGPHAFGSPRSSIINLIYYISHKIFLSLRSQYLAKFAINSKGRFSIDLCLCPEIVVWFFLYRYVAKGVLRSAVLPF